MPKNIMLVLGYQYYGSIEQTLNCLTRRHVVASGLVPVLLIRQMPEDYRLSASALGLQPWQVIAIPEGEPVGDFLSETLQANGIKQWKVEAIVNSMDFMWPAFLELCNTYDSALQYPSREAVERAALKHNFRHLSKIKEVHSIPYVVVPASELDRTETLVAMIESAFGRGDISLVVKPIIGGGSAGISIVSSRDIEALENGVKRAAREAEKYLGAAAQCWSMDHGRQIACNAYVLLEEYLPGSEYSLEGVVDPRGKVSHCLVQHKGRSDDRFRDFEYWVSRQNGEENQFSRLAQDLVDLVHHRGGAFHIEARSNAAGILYPIEFNPRAGGGSIPDLFCTIYGFDLRDEPLARFCDVLVGTYHIVTTVIHAEETGELVRYEGLEELEKEKGIVFWKELCKPKDPVTKDRECYLIEFAMWGRDLESTRIRAERLAKRIKAVISKRPVT